MKDSVRSMGVLIICLVILSVAFAGCTTTQKTATSGESATPAQVTTGTPVAAPVACPTGFADCNGACRDITSDVLNCGGCANTCPASSTCKDSQCLCKEGFAACNGQCQDVTSDTANCGACKNQCSVGEKCTNGVCATPGVTTTTQPAVAYCESPELSICGNLCYNLNSHPQNCGRCGNSCPTGMDCSNGVCAVAAGTCPVGQTLCGNSCADLSSNPQNCGKCGIACGAGTCSSGNCIAASSGYTVIDSIPSGLTKCTSGSVDLQTNTLNCGVCGTACTAGQTCSSGKCTSIFVVHVACPSPKKDCGSGCIDVTTDVNNCGTCGHVCNPPGQLGIFKKCLAGQCVKP